ncbi:DgyrCDS3421 [Dimorphilus gyrociliatus]|uniref:DgyrCDS3421 n=1 Tax=Dimorphilus gyrociliatus TaxID=2664684 RepID=A0A7I8VF37_9ANNE|nr:DgyrCDS3421 [Dimorphilus gyrociliatus]
MALPMSRENINGLIHPNPGYGDCISRFRRAKTAYPTIGRRYIEPSYMKRNEDEFILSDLKQRAFEAWSGSQYDGETTYKNHFSNIQNIEQPLKRPTSATRKNNPHPPLVFLECRLHHVPGYHNADTTVGRPAYKVDASTTQAEQEHRHALRSKFVPERDQQALLQYKTSEDENLLGKIKDPIVKQAARAWMKEANNDIKLSTKEALRNSLDASNLQVSNNTKKYASICRFGKFAGAEETAVQERIAGESKRPLAVDLTLKREKDIESMGKCERPKGKHQVTRRGDFLLHPQWPPTFKHHRLNGLSSVDIPYSSNTRPTF